MNLICVFKFSTKNEMFYEQISDYCRHISNWNVSFRVLTLMRNSHPTGRSGQWPPWPARRRGRSSRRWWWEGCRPAGHRSRPPSWRWAWGRSWRSSRRETWPDPPCQWPSLWRSAGLILNINCHNSTSNLCDIQHYLILAMDTGLCDQE